MQNNDKQKRLIDEEIYDDKERLENLKTNYDYEQLILEYGKDRAQKVLQYYEREKGGGKKAYDEHSLEKSGNNTFFDCETYEHYFDPTDKNEEPIIIPYLIGCLHPNCTETVDEEGKTNYNIDYKYKYFQGINAAPEFIEHIFDKKTWGKCTVVGKRYLHAYNLDYDFHVIRPGITTLYPDVYINYTLTDRKKFLFGDLSKDCRFKIKLNDLGKWDTGKGSLKNYMKTISAMIYEADGTLKTDETATELYDAMDYMGFDRESFAKLQLEDYKKVNLYIQDDDYFYGTSKEDGIAEKDLPHEQRVLIKKLDLEHELKYLEIDVKSLYVIREEQSTFKRLIAKTLNLKEFMDKPSAISVPGFGKGLCEEYEKKFMTQTYRPGVTLEEYNRQNDSYTGAFVGGNKDITYLDEEVFKAMYPEMSFYDAKNLPRIKSYDVHSMYPGVMSTGLPVGHPTPLPPEKGEYVIGHEVLFTKYGTTDVTKRDRVRGLGGKLYDGKPEYACLNNSFFGTNYEVGIIPGCHAQSKVYIEDSLGKLFDSMCNHHGVIIATRYQKISKKLVPFVKALYEVKCTTKDKSLKAAVKLVLNSLYGKMAERFKEKSLQGKSHVADIIFENPHYFETLKHEQIKHIRDLTEQKQKRARVQRNITPSIDIKFDSGFLVTRNLRGRYNQQLQETRESILAGCYITSRARGKLLSNVKKVIDTGNVFLYADTDSIKYIELTHCPLETDKLDKDGNPIKEELGKWGYEGSFTHFGHPNKLKKYFMYNKHTEQWMVKTSGVGKSYLKTPEGKFDLEMIKTIYDPNNRIRVKNCRPRNVRNRHFQIVIKPKLDFYFVYEDVDLKETHILENNVIKKCK